MASYLKEALMDYTTEDNLTLCQQVFGAVTGRAIYNLVGGHPERLLTLKSNTIIGHRVAAFVELARRMMTPSVKVSFTASTDVAHWYMPRFAGKKQEEFVVLLLDARNKLIEDRVITVGSLTASIIHPREVFKAAIQVSAAAMILVHNHPSGDPAPSQDDLKITAQLVDAAKIMDIRILDHIIIGADKFVSLAGKGMME